MALIFQNALSRLFSLSCLSDMKYVEIMALILIDWIERDV